MIKCPLHYTDMESSVTDQLATYIGDFSNIEVIQFKVFYLVNVI